MIIFEFDLLSLQLLSLERQEEKPMVKETFVRYPCNELNLIKLVFNATTDQ